MMFLCDFAAPSDPLLCLHSGVRGSEPCPTPAAALEQGSCTGEIITNSYQNKGKRAQALQCIKPEVKEKTILWILSKVVKNKGCL